MPLAQMLPKTGGNFEKWGPLWAKNNMQVNNLSPYSVTLELKEKDLLTLQTFWSTVGQMDNMPS